MSQERFTAFISKLSGFDLNDETVTTILQKAINEVYEVPASPKRPTSLWQAFVKKTVPTLKTEIGEDGKPLSTKDRMRRTADLWGSLTDEDKVKLSEELGCSWKPSKGCIKLCKAKHKRTADKPKMNIYIKLEFGTEHSNRGDEYPWVSEKGSFNASKSVLLPGGQIPSLRQLSYCALSQSPQMDHFQELVASHISDFDDCKIPEIPDWHIYDCQFERTGCRSGHSVNKVAHRATIKVKELPKELYAVYGSSEIHDDSGCSSWDEYNIHLMGLFESKIERDTAYPNPNEYNLFFTTLIGK